MLSELAPYNANVDVYDPWVSHEDAKHEYDLEMIDEPAKGHYVAIIIAVSHQQFKDMGADGLHALGKENHVLYDIKYILPSESVDGRL